MLAFRNTNNVYSNKVRFRCDGEIFDLRRLKSKTKTLTLFIEEAQYADDIAIFCNSAGLQLLLSAYNALSTKMGLSINIKKTETMHCDPELQNKGIKSKNEVWNIESFLHHLY